MILVLEHVNIALKLSVWVKILALDNECVIDKFNNGRIRVEHC